MCAVGELFQKISNVLPMCAVGELFQKISNVAEFSGELLEVVLIGQVLL